MSIGRMLQIAWGCIKLIPVRIQKERQAEKRYAAAMLELNRNINLAKVEKYRQILQGGPRRRE